MTRSLRRLTLVLCVTAFPFGCQCGPSPTPDEADSGHAHQGQPDGSVSMVQDAGAPDASTVIDQPDPSRPDNATRDSDCDGLSDEEEYGIVWPSGQRTDPASPDTDGDGIPDGREAGRISSVDTRCAGRFTADTDPARTTDPTSADSDADGLSDGAEDANRDGAYARGVESDPRNPDSDGDGLCDGPNDVPDVCTGGDPTPIPLAADQDADGLPDILDAAPDNPDADGDGLCDGPAAVIGVCVAGEDRDVDGYRDADETDPARVDTDCDGLVDGHSDGVFRGELDEGTDPVDPDSDGDGLRDGVELGITMLPDASCSDLVPDADSATTTDPNAADSDGDGIPDGAEDTNQNGRVDQGELDPRNPADGTSDPATQAACALGNLVQVHRQSHAAPDQQVVTAERGADAFTEQTFINIPEGEGGRVVGVMGFNAVARVAYLAITDTPRGADAVAEEAAVRTLLDGVGTINTPITYRFTTWDGYDAVHATYAMDGNAGVKARANAIVSLLKPSAAGLLPTAQDVDSASGFLVHAEFVRRSAQTAVVLIALTPADGNSEAAAFTLKDTADGSALGQYADSLGTQCDRFASAAYAPVDILWAVDNSVSMSDEQNAVAASAAAMEARLAGATVDWRAAVVSSGFYNPRGQTDTPPCTNQVCNDTLESQCRPFTRDLQKFAGWLTEGNPTWIGAGGHCNTPQERIVHGAELMLSPSTNMRASFMPAQQSADAMHLREGSNLVLILVGVADDQKYTNTQLPGGIDDYEAFFRALPVASVNMGAILCPGGECGEAQRNPHVATNLVNRFGGVLGSLRDLQSIEPTINAILDAAVGAVSPYVLSRSAISATVKVSMEPNATIGTCNWSDVPRSRTHGFDYDSRNRTISFFGNCRPDPASPGKRIAVSYRYWIDQSPDADPQPSACGICGGCPGISRCDLDACACVCDRAITCGPGFRWNQDACDCECDTEALGCGPTHQADSALCACVCKPDCGGCEGNFCQQSLCECVTPSG